MKTQALAGALVPDSAGVWPGQENYTPTYDVYFAAVGLVGFLKAQPVVRASSSEGTSVSVDAPNWSGLEAWYKSMSKIYQTTGGSVLQVVPIPGGPEGFWTNMAERGVGYDDVDTDLG
jgi:hypothetical protein